MKFKNLFISILFISLLAVNSSLAGPDTDDVREIQQLNTISQKSVFPTPEISQYCLSNLYEFCKDVENEILFIFLKEEEKIEDYFKNAMNTIMTDNENSQNFDKCLPQKISMNLKKLILTRISHLCAQACVDSLIEKFATLLESGQTNFFEENKDVLIKSLQEAIKEGLEEYIQWYQTTWYERLVDEGKKYWVIPVAGGVTFLVSRNWHYSLMALLAFGARTLYEARKQTKSFSVEGKKDFYKKGNTSKLEKSHLRKERRQRFDMVHRGVQKRQNRKIK